MPAPFHDMPGSADDPKIIASLVSEQHRLDFLPRHFGKYFFATELAVYSHMGQLCAGYVGGYWDFFELNNGGCFIAPSSGTFLLAAPNGFEATVTAESAGLIASLYALSALAFDFQSEDVFSARFHQLREYALAHADARVILAAID